MTVRDPFVFAKVVTGRDFCNRAEMTGIQSRIESSQSIALIGPRRERRNTASWICDTDQREWDEDIQKDIEHGLWEELAEDALKDHNDSKTKEL